MSPSGYHDRAFKQLLKSFGVTSTPIDLPASDTEHPGDKAKGRALLRIGTAWENDFSPSEDESDHLLLVHGYYDSKNKPQASLAFCRNTNDPEGDTVPSKVRGFLQHAPEGDYGPWRSLTDLAKADMMDCHPFAKAAFCAVFTEPMADPGEHASMKEMLETFRTFLVPSGTRVSDIGKNTALWSKLETFLALNGFESESGADWRNNKTESQRRTFIKEAVQYQFNTWVAWNPEDLALQVKRAWQETLTAYVTAAIAQLESQTQGGGHIKVVSVTAALYENLLSGTRPIISRYLSAHRPIRPNGSAIQWTLPSPEIYPPVKPVRSDPTAYAKVSHSSGAPAVMVSSTVETAVPFSEEAVTVTFSFCLNDNPDCRFTDSPQWEWLLSATSSDQWLRLSRKNAVEVLEPWTRQERFNTAKDPDLATTTRKLLNSRAVISLKGWMDEHMPGRDRSLDPMIVKSAPKRFERSQVAGTVIELPGQGSK